MVATNNTPRTVSERVPDGFDLVIDALFTVPLGVALILTTREGSAVVFGAVVFGLWLGVLTHDIGLRFRARRAGV